MSTEEEKYQKTADEAKIDLLNKAESNVFIHLFIRNCTIFGYSLILVTGLSVYFGLLSLISFQDNKKFYENGFPKINLFYLCFLLAGNSFIWIFFGMIANTYVYDICCNGLKGGVVAGIRTQYFKISLLLVLLISILVVAYVSFVDYFNANFLISEAVFYLFSMTTFLWAFSTVYRYVHVRVKPLISPEKKNHLLLLNNLKKQKKAVTVKRKGDGFRNLSRILVQIPLVMVFACYYVYFTIIIFRASNNYGKAAIALIFHPLLVDTFVTFLRFDQGDANSIYHPFVEHLFSFGLEALLNLFRRFLFNDSSSLSLTLLFVFISGIEECFARSNMERKEVFLRKLLGTKKLGDIDLVSKRKFYSHTVTARSILEIVSIFLVPIMKISVSNNRLAIDLGYDGMLALDLPMLCTTTLIQIIVELLVVYLCSLIEYRQNIPMSDFFFHFRSSPVIFSHFAFFIASSNWILYNFKTIPNTLFCLNVNDPCTCQNFNVYESICSQIGTHSANITSLLEFTRTPIYNPENIPAIVSIFIIILIVIVSFLVIKRLDYIKRVEENKSKQNVLLRKREINEEIIMNDDATACLMENSYLNKAILTIESINQGISPQQSKLLGNIILILKKNQNGSNKNIVNMDGLLNDSGDVLVSNWLHDQLTSSTIHNNRRTIHEHKNQLEIFPNVDFMLEVKGKEIADDYLSWDFNIFSIKSKNPQSFLAWKCMSYIGLIEELKLEKAQLSNLLLFVEKHYSLIDYDSYPAYLSHDEESMIMTKDKIEKGNNNNDQNPYHNNYHGADVFQAVLYFATTYKDIGGAFTSFDLFSVLFAAYIHDFNHPGLNTTYMNSDWPMSGISSTFGVDSPLEKHHLAMAFNLMRNEAEYNFLSSCSSTEINTFRRIVTECVMITDLAKSMSWISTTRIAFNDIRNNVSIINNNSINPISSLIVDEKKVMDNKILKMQLIIKCADVGHPARKLDLHLEWSERIKEEFYLQGDKERSKGMTISPLCDRNISASSYPQSQIGFINFISKPVFILLLSEISNDDETPWMDYLNTNIEYWENRKRGIEANISRQ